MTMSAMIIEISETRQRELECLALMDAADRAPPRTFEPSHQARLTYEIAKMIADGPSPGDVGRAEEDYYNAVRAQGCAQSEDVHSPEVE